MAVIRKSVSIPANTNRDDQLTTDGIRDQSRRASADGMVDLYATQSAAGIELDIICGDAVQGSAIAPVVKAIAPIAPDDIVGSFPIMEGEVVAMPVRNTTGGALTLGYFLDVP